MVVKAGPVDYIMYMIEEVMGAAGLTYCPQ